ncbi:hypothetical protein [Phyllobacterium endophyticum]|uniref:hypothetical protein n=1 Tax=Phyllobacterium endophyticum TaxID=1149773 RepID=UPI0011C89601|nr:hypothetical protein [Phyllobacterium endophyticum]
MSVASLPQRNGAAGVIPRPKDLHRPGARARPTISPEFGCAGKPICESHSASGQLYVPSSYNNPATLSGVKQARRIPPPPTAATEATSLRLIRDGSRHEEAGESPAIASRQLPPR